MKSFRLIILVLYPFLYTVGVSNATVVESDESSGHSSCFLCPGGIVGPQGLPGRDGRDGRDATLQESGAIYTRWGSSECPDGANLIYSGTIGGSKWDHSGSGANYLCLPEEPIFDETDQFRTQRALVYPSEYAVRDTNERISLVNDFTPSCAVCRAPSGRSTKLMIPARNVCPSREWRLEYAGYIMAGRWAQKKSTYVCVDRGMGYKNGTEENHDGALLFLAEYRCVPGMDCSPYIPGYELTCAVCTI